MNVKAVSEFYNDHPYPAHGVVSTVVARMLEHPVRKLTSLRQVRPLRILDAGCGTGEQTLGIKKRFPNCQVFGYDLNKPSVEYAQRLADRKQVDVTFALGDLLRLPIEPQSFDIVVSVGVLHHLSNPRDGFTALTRYINDDGMLLGMVYGTFGRWETLCTRDAVKRICGELPLSDQLSVMRVSSLANNVGLSHYLQLINRRRKFGPQISLMEAGLRVIKGRSKAYQADSFLHPQDTTYTWAELSDLLEETGWLFEGWPAKSGMPDSPTQLFAKQALSLVSRRSLIEQAGIYERIVKPACLYFFAKRTGV